jgi:hypothetical protein
MHFILPTFDTTLYVIRNTTISHPVRGGGGNGGKKGSPMGGGGGGRNPPGPGIIGGTGGGGGRLVGPVEVRALTFPNEGGCIVGLDGTGGACIGGGIM